MYHSQKHRPGSPKWLICCIFWQRVLCLLDWALPVISLLSDHYDILCSVVWCGVVVWRLTLYHRVTVWWCQCYSSARRYSHLTTEHCQARPGTGWNVATRERERGGTAPVPVTVLHWERGGRGGMTTGVSSSAENNLFFSQCLECTECCWIFPRFLQSSFENHSESPSTGHKTNKALTHPIMYSKK